MSTPYNYATKAYDKIVSWTGQKFQESRGHPIKQVAYGVVGGLAAFAAGGLVAATSLVSPKAWAETAYMVSRPKETGKALWETFKTGLAGNPALVTGMLGTFVGAGLLGRAGGRLLSGKIGRITEYELELPTRLTYQYTDFARGVQFTLKYNVEAGRKPSLDLFLFESRGSGVDFSRWIMASGNARKAKTSVSTRPKGLGEFEVVLGEKRIRYFTEIVEGGGKTGYRWGGYSSGKDKVMVEYGEIFLDKKTGKYDLKYWFRDPAETIVKRKPEQMLTRIPSRVQVWDPIGIPFTPVPVPIGVLRDKGIEGSGGSQREDHRQDQGGRGDVKPVVDPGVREGTVVVTTPGYRPVQFEGTKQDEWVNEDTTPGPNPPPPPPPIIPIPDVQSRGGSRFRGSVGGGGGGWRPPRWTWWTYSEILYPEIDPLAVFGKKRKEARKGRRGKGRKKDRNSRRGRR